LEDEQGANAQNSRKIKELQSVIDELEGELENERAARQKVSSGNIQR
jgi:transcription initiation factor IIE alpha subunit